MVIGILVVGHASVSVIVDSDLVRKEELVD